MILHIDSRPLLLCGKKIKEQHISLAVLIIA